jgi:hypothetical protein
MKGTHRPRRTGMLFRTKQSPQAFCRLFLPFRYTTTFYPYFSDYICCCYRFRIFKSIEGFFEPGTYTGQRRLLIASLSMIIVMSLRWFAVASRLLQDSLQAWTPSILHAVATKPSTPQNTAAPGPYCSQQLIYDWCWSGKSCQAGTWRLFTSLCLRHNSAMAKTRPQNCK